MGVWLYAMCLIILTDVYHTEEVPLTYGNQTKSAQTADGINNRIPSLEFASRV